MWSFFIILAIAIIGSVLYYIWQMRDDWVRKYEQDGVIKSMIFFSILFVFFSSMTLAVIHPGKYYTEIEKGYINLISIQDSTSITGHFYTFGGTIDQKAVYYYYMQDDSGAIKMYHINAEGTSIYEDAPANTGYIEIDKEVVGKDWENQWRGWLLYQHNLSLPSYAVHVPEGTVKRGFSLGLPN